MENIHENVQEEKSHGTNKVRDELYERGDRMANTLKGAVVSELNSFGSALHSAADTLHERNDRFAGWADSISERVDSAKNFINERNPRELANSANEISQRNPGITVGGMFLAGLALSRYLKAGSSER